MAAANRALKVKCSGEFAGCGEFASAQKLAVGGDVQLSRHDHRNCARVNMSTINKMCNFLGERISLEERVSSYKDIILKYNSCCF